MARTRVHVAVALAGALAALALAPRARGGDPPVPAAAPPVEDASYTPLSVALVTPAALPPLDPMVVGGLSLNILYGRARSVFGVELGAVVNRETAHMGGVQFGSFLNWVEGTAGGVQLSAGINYDEGGCYGIVLGMLGNYCGGDAAGLRVGGFYEEIGGRADGIELSAALLYAKKGGALLQLAPVTMVGSGSGVQIAPLFAGADESFDGLQIAFATNVLHEFSGLQLALIVFDNQTVPVSAGSCGYNCTVSEWTEFPNARTRGLVIAGGMRAQNFAGLQVALFNSVQHRVEGVQLGGIVNQGGETTGLQLAPLVNYAEDFAGLQLGAINIAEDVEGVQIGVINVARELTGLQLGAINVAYANKLPFMVLANAGF